MPISNQRPDRYDHSNCCLQGPLYDNAFRFEAAFRRGYFLAFLGMQCRHAMLSASMNLISWLAPIPARSKVPSADATEARGQQPSCLLKMCRDELRRLLAG